MHCSFLLGASLIQVQYTICNIQFEFRSRYLWCDCHAEEHSDEGYDAHMLIRDKLHLLALCKGLAGTFCYFGAYVMKVLRRSLLRAPQHDSFYLQALLLVSKEDF